MSEETTTNTVNKENRITDYVKSLAAIEEAMEPYKEQKRALKANYVENGWLEKEEQLLVAILLDLKIKIHKK